MTKPNSTYNTIKKLKHRFDYHASTNNFSNSHAQIMPTYTLLICP